jgi:cysteine desulfuration protein SufE
MVSERVGDTVVIQGDSDAFIVKGLVAILLALYSGLTPAEIAAVNVEQVFADLDLTDHLTPNRRNGFFSMVQRIRAFGVLAA